MLHCWLTCKANLSPSPLRSREKHYTVVGVQIHPVYDDFIIDFYQDNRFCSRRSILWKVNVTGFSFSNGRNRSEIFTISIKSSYHGI